MPSPGSEGQTRVCARGCLASFVTPIIKTVTKKR